MATLINRIQRAILGSAGPDKVRALLAELQIPGGGSGGTIREVRRGVLRPISDEAILRDALANIGLTGGGGGGGNQALSSIRTAILHNLVDSETTLRDGLDGLLAPGDLAEGGGGGGGWIPDNAKIHIDLVGGTPQGRAWVEGTGEVAVDTLLGTDPASGDAWADSEYDPANLTADGYVVATTSLALIGAAESFMLDEVTFVIRGKQILDVAPGALENPEFRLLSDDGMDSVVYKLRPNFGSAHVQSENGSLAGDIESIVNTGLGSINVIAGTLTATRADIAVNGSTAVAGVMDETDRPPGNPFTIILWSNGGPAEQYALQSITLYDPLPDTDGLSELSEVT